MVAAQYNTIIYEDNGTLVDSATHQPGAAMMNTKAATIVDQCQMEEEVEDLHCIPQTLYHNHCGMHVHAPPLPVSLWQSSIGVGPQSRIDERTSP